MAAGQARKKAAAPRKQAAVTRTSSSGYSSAQVLAYIKQHYPFTPASTAAWDKAHPFKNDYAAWIRAHPFTNDRQCITDTRSSAVTVWKNYTSAEVLAYIKKNYPFTATTPSAAKAATAKKPVKAVKAQKP